MGIVNTKSTQITNRDAIPSVLNNPGAGGGGAGAFVREAFGSANVAATDASTSTYRLCSIPSNARISGVFVYTDAVPGGGACAADIGLYDVSGPVAVSSGAKIGDGDHFAEALDIHTAILNGSDITFKANEDSVVSSANQFVWQVLGLSSDPIKLYDVVATLTADNSTGAFKLGVKVQYVL